MTPRKTTSPDLGRAAAASGAGRPAAGVLVRGAALYDCDQMSLELCTNIGLIACAAIARLSPAADDLVAARELLRLLATMAADLMNCINALAEQAGCGYIDHEGEAFRAAVSKQGSAA